MQHIFVKRTHEDGLTQEIWGFAVFDFFVCLDAYSKLFRKTRRHKFEASNENRYSRLHDRDTKMTEADVPFPKDVQDEAREQVVSLVRVGLWQRDYGGSR